MYSKSLNYFWPSLEVLLTDSTISPSKINVLLLTEVKPLVSNGLSIKVSKKIFTSDTKVCRNSECLEGGFYT